MKHKTSISYAQMGKQPSDELGEYGENPVSWYPRSRRPGGESRQSSVRKPRVSQDTGTLALTLTLNGRAGTMAWGLSFPIRETSWINTVLEQSSLKPVLALESGIQEAPFTGRVFLEIQTHTSRHVFAF